ncbi:PhnE/PtxC family ABC transporter permease [Paenibacillus piri]|uniref:ABC transporter permease subunit n=1 Tax=Paenibacillus piri TaxID=2547395 RepID=A0A4R5KIZ2_9BACL|nr:ABC transporter permease subunit [Paenibacillus piri]TDF94748.1 ABC transporter permease subunit [Paenibacillus piri]
MGLQETIKAVYDKDTDLKTTLDERMKAKPFNKQAMAIRLTLTALAILTLYGFATFDYKDIQLLDAVYSMAITVKTMFFQPSINHFTFGDGLKQVSITLGLAFLTTLFGSFVALFLSLLAARNLSDPRLSIVIKGGVAFIRAVPTVLWVLIFAVAAGLGSVAAVIGMTFHSVSYLVKAYSESFEELDKGVIEALKASGANWWQIVFQAVIPSSVTYLISWTFMRFEINFAVAVAMGAAAGAGGIGYDMFMASSFYYDVREIGAITYFILVFAILLEIMAGRIKKKLKVHD